MKTKGIERPIEILLVEDNPGDVRLILEVFKEARVANKIIVAQDGEEAIKILQKTGRYSHQPPIDLILLDLNLPKKDGREVLREIKEDINLKCIPVIILTTSEADEDIMDTYCNNVNAYITKPVDLEHFIKVVKILQDFWLKAVKLPSGDYYG